MAAAAETSREGGNGVMRKLRTILGVGLVSALVAAAGWHQPTSASETVPDRGAWMGVSVKPLTDAWRERTEYHGSGVLVTGVAPGSRADLAGVAPGDLLVMVGTLPLKTDEDLS